MTEFSKPVAGVVSAVVPVLAQTIDVALVSPEPPSLKLTWMSASGGLVNVAELATLGRLMLLFLVKRH